MDSSQYWEDLFGGSYKKDYHSWGLYWGPHCLGSYQIMFCGGCYVEVLLLALAITEQYAVEPASYALFVATCAKPNLKGS